MATETAQTTPNAPSYLPADAAAKWTKAYQAAFTQAKSDSPNDPKSWPGTALRGANAMLKVKPPATIADVNALPPWQIAKRVQKVIDGKSYDITVTTDGKKYRFDVPAEPAAPAAAPAATQSTKAPAAPANT